MPPKRKRAVPPAQPNPPPQEPVASPTPPPASEDDQVEDPDTTAGSRGSDSHDTASPLPTLFNTTFALYRASPLYLGPERLTKSRLRTLSQRLRDTLVGDVVRGVQVGLTGGADDAALGRAGALESVDWRWVPVRKLLPRRRRGDGGRGSKRRRQGRDGSAELGSRNEESEEEGENGSDDADDEDRNADARALSVELRYENSTFAACLLPRLYQHGDDGDDSENTAASQWTMTSLGVNSNGGKSNALVADPKQFLHLPLLLLRMPAPLRTVINDFLARTFDMRVRPLRLGTRTLVSSWAAWHAESGIDNNSNNDEGGRRLVKDVVLSLGFHVVDESSPLTKEQQQDQGKLQVADPTKGSGGDKKNNTGDMSTTTKSLGLKAIDIIIPATDVRRFVRAGQQAIHDGDEETSSQNKRKGKRKAGAASPPSAEKTPISPSRRRKLAGGKDDEGWAWRSTETGSESRPEAAKEPFTEALALYLDRHLALNMFHPGVRVLRVACEGFVLSEGGRLKVFTPPAEDGTKSAWKFLDGLVERARGRDWGSVPVIPGLG